MCFLTQKIYLFFIISPLFLYSQQPADNYINHRASDCIHAAAAKDDGIRAENSRSDTIDILDYDIHLNITDFTSQTISGYTTISFQSKMDDVSEILLDLLALTVDSVIQDGQQLAFSHLNELLTITLSQTLSTADSTKITVYYHGNPVIDASGWGGFYFSGDYAYNLGVGFAADPHVYGRVWFPCFDNFVERSTYHFSITTENTKMALCNGEFISGTDNADGTKTWNWYLAQTIPTYLACVAVGNYSPAYFDYYGIEDTIPVQLAATAADTTDMKNSFIHLTDALTAFESDFGPYRWSKVGYTLVPFTGGAMEHATNITYPQFMADGTTTWEDFLVHELSHHWFGNLVTCETAEDMWLNEGWASYCEYLFYEHVYGKEKYDEEVAANHAYVVHLAHTPFADGQYFPVSGVPQDYTYGTTVYDKGADMVHTLRSYMGDSLFFQCVTNFLDDHQFSAVNSYTLRDDLSTCSGIDLTSFFDDWIFSPGFAQFSIDSIQVNPIGNEYAVNVYIKQRLNHAPHYYNNVPLEITFMDENWTTQVNEVMMSGRCGIYSAILPLNPIYAGLDLAEKISDAITADNINISATGIFTLVNGAITLNVSTITDSAIIRIEHNYAPPDGFKIPIPTLHISDYHYWKVDGIIPDGFDASATIGYNGSFSTSGYVDNNLITNSEDSLVVLYRASSKYDWSVITDYTQNFFGSHNDKVGNFTINHLQKGEYAFGIYDYDKVDSIDTLETDACIVLSSPLLPDKTKEKLIIYPNPTADSFTLDYELLSSSARLNIFSMEGKAVLSETLQKGNHKRTISTSSWRNGIYLIQVADTLNNIISTRLVVGN